MPASKNAFRSLTKKLKRACKYGGYAGNPREIDALLDHWVLLRYCATDYDARRWGFDPEHWMAPERMTMEEQARCGRPGGRVDSRRANSDDRHSLGQE